jgi:SAM-dependent methyltransferase
LPPQGDRLVDVGAGFGRLANLYAGYREVVLVDYSRSQLEHARQRLGDERFVYVAADLYRLPLATGAVDAVVMVRVLHHIADVPAALGHLARILTPQGVLVLEFANKRHIKNIARYLLGKGTNPFGREPYEFAELHFDFHPGWVQARLADVGLVVRRRLSVSILRAGFLKRRLPTNWLVRLDAALQRPTAALTPAPSVFVRAQRPESSDSPAVERARLFRCPACGHEPLDQVDDGVVCRACQESWPIINGVYVFK